MNVVSILLYIFGLLLLAAQIDSTLSQRKKAKKEKRKNRPEGIAFENKKLPNKCQVCRLMAEEMTKSMEGKKPELTEEQKKKKKRQERRKTKAEKKREKELPILVAIEDVCDQMLEYVPQEENKKNFRYVRTKDLKDTKYLITTQLENEDAADVLSDTYDRFRHPETNRMMALCDEIINKYENQLVLWNSQDDRPELIDFLCKERVLNAADDEEIACLEQETVRDSLWTKAFDVILEKNPDLKNTEF